MHSLAPDDAGAGGTLASSAAGLVLIVDDVPDNLALLHDALDAAGYTVLVATHGEAALQRAAQAQPDILLLDAVMPGLDGFEVARRLKADPDTAHIPIVFMTGLTETEHVVAAFAAGGIDYVTKPIRPPEVLARIAAHMHTARQASQARNALDAYGHATLAIRIDGEAAPRAVWQTALARELLPVYFPKPPDSAADAAALPGELLHWLRGQLGDAERGEAPRPLTVARGALADGTDARDKRLVLTLQQRTADGDWLVVMREVSDAAALEALTQALRLTLREAEVLYWVVKGKTNRDIGDILGSSPATVKKQLEHVYAKLGVETRTAAAAVATERLRALAVPLGR